MRVAIDARLWGEPRSGIGRYTRSLVEALGSTVTRAEITVGERDPYDPLPVEERLTIARHLVTAAGLNVDSADEDIRSIDPGAIVGVRR